MVNEKLLLGDIFDFFTDDEVENLLPYLEETQCAKGETLFQPEDVAERVYFLLNGRLAVKTNTGFDNKMQVVALLGQGAIVGEGGILEERCRNTTIVAVEDTDLIGLSKSKFQVLETDHPQIVIKLLKRLLSVTTLRLFKISERLAHVM